MRLAVAHDYRYVRADDGGVYTNAPCGYTFWKRFLGPFDSIVLLSRTLSGRPPQGSHRVDGPGVEVTSLPYYVGPAAFVKVRRSLVDRLRESVRPDDAILLRDAGMVSYTLHTLISKDRAFGVEVVGDPDQALGAITHPVRHFVRPMLSSALRRQCRQAAAVCYVTERVLQDKYPAAPGAFTTSCSDVSLTDEAYVAQPRKVAQPQEPSLVFVGSMEQLYKAQDILLGAVAHCVRAGRPMRLLMIGEGRYRPMLQRMAAQLGIKERVCFAGSIPAGGPVRQRLDEADIFVLPSRTEGLPKALLEAMARGLPCVASRIGGMVELLPEEDLVTADSVDSLAQMLLDVSADPDRMSRMSARNLETSRRYHADIMQARREVFLYHLREATAARQTAYASR